jgi:hypothetical protein
VSSYRARRTLATSSVNTSEMSARSARDDEWAAEAGVRDREARGAGAEDAANDASGSSVASAMTLARATEGSFAGRE